MATENQWCGPVPPCTALASARRPGEKSPDMPPPPSRSRSGRALPVVLSIAGSDSSAGAGIQADLLTFAACKAFGTTAITCLTAQNPSGVTAVHSAPAASVREQAEQVARFFPVRAAKTGMLFDTPIIEAVADFFQCHRIPLVVDPVMVATSGAALLQAAAVGALRTRLFPLATLITPNLDEAAVLLGRRPQSPADLREAALALARLHRTAVLLKGGHLTGPRLRDVLARPNGRVRVFESTRINQVDTHGSGCTLSAAIAAHLARGADLEQAVERARQYLRRGMRSALRVGGRRFIAH